MRVLSSLIIFWYIACTVSCGSDNQATSSAAESDSSISSTSSSSQSSISNNISSLVLDTNSASPCNFIGTIDNEHATIDGQAYWNGSNTVENSLKFELNSAAVSEVKIHIRYANGGEGARPATAAIGSNRQQIDFSPTDAWDQWNTVTINVTSDPEAYSFEITSTSTNGLPNIDQIIIEGGDISMAPCSNTSPYSPNVSSEKAPPDTFLSIAFDQPPSISNSGSIRITDMDTGNLVDEIQVQGHADFLKAPNQTSGRAVNKQAVVVIGNQIRIYPRNNVLQNDRQYMVTIANGSFSGVIDGQQHTEVTSGAWTFSTRSLLPLKQSITVDDNGSSDFRTVQGALNFTMENQLNNVEIAIGPGNYYELLYLRGLNNITLIGAGENATKIFHRNAEFLNSGSGKSTTSIDQRSGGRSIFLIEGTDMLTLKNLSIHNTYQRSENGGQGAQAETIYFNSNTGRLIAQNTSFLSEQDTLLLKGYSWFYNSKISGNVDFIWGYPKVALFENSTIESVGDSKNPAGDGGGYVVQARVQNANDPGIVFLNSRFTSAPGPAGNIIGTGKTYLARSGNAANTQSVFDNVSFINCAFDAHIAPIGWFDESSKGKNPNPTYSNAQVGLREYGSKNLTNSLIYPQRHGSFYSLTNSEYTTRFNNRQTLFGLANQNGAWLNEP